MNPGTSVQRISGQEDIRKAKTAPLKTNYASALRGEKAPKRIALAPKSLGLILMGTVVATPPEKSLAVIRHENGNQQIIYYKGDRAGNVLIKRILRNEVIIDAGGAEERLTMLHGQPAYTHPAPQQVLRDPFEQRQPGSNGRLPGRHRTVSLDPEEVASAMGDVNRVLQGVNLSPVESSDGLEGFRITDIPRGSILSKLGLMNGDVIKAVNEEAITGPEQVTKFLERVREGDKITLTVNKRRRTRHIHIEIH